MRDFGSKQSTTWDRDDQAAAAWPSSGKRTLTETLPAAMGGAPMHRKVEEAPAPPRPTIHELFGAVGAGTNGTPINSAAAGAAISGVDPGAHPVVPQLPGGDRLDIPVAGADEPTAAEAAGSSGGMPLSPEVRGPLEARFGALLDGVRVHTDAGAAKRAAAAGAHAFAAGQHIYFAAGKYAPGTPEGDRLLAHEVVHALQAGRGGEASGRVSDPADLAEQEAESLASRPTGPAARPAQTAHGVMRQQTNAITPEVIAAMARRPRAGFARWSQLTEQQRNDVLSAMIANYSVPFSSAFLQAANNPGQRNYDASTATDGQQVGFDMIDSAWLTTHGYRLVGLLGGTGPQLWSRPNGQEYYLLRRSTPMPPATATPPPTTPTPPQPPPRDRQAQTTAGMNRILVEARFGISAWFDDLREARNAHNASDYASTRQGLLQTLGGQRHRRPPPRRGGAAPLRPPRGAIPMWTFASSISSMRWTPGGARSLASSESFPRCRPDRPPVAMRRTQGYYVPCPILN